MEYTIMCVIYKSIPGKPDELLGKKSDFVVQTQDFRGGQSVQPVSTCNGYKTSGVERKNKSINVDPDRSIDYINHMTLVSQIDMSGVPRVIPTRSKLALEQSQSKVTEQNEPVTPTITENTSGQGSGNMASMESGDITDSLKAGATAPPDGITVPFKTYPPPPPLSTLPEIEKIISDDKRGDPGAVSDAINQIYFLMYEATSPSSHTGLTVKASFNI